MFIPGLIKYGEKIWVLWSASKSKRRESTLKEGIHEFPLQHLPGCSHLSEEQKLVAALRFLSLCKHHMVLEGFIKILLTFLGNRRKYSNKLWIRIVVWSAYITADSVATFALGILSSNLIELYDKDHGSSSSLDANTQLSAFWAPFLILHLGGPDTITAYALEDNELWLRHLIGLFVQTGMAISIFLLSWTASGLSILSLVMFFPGIIKYGERVCVLRSTTRQKRRQSYRFVLTSNDNLRIVSEEDIWRFVKDNQGISSHAFLDDTMIQNIRFNTLCTFRAMSHKNAFKVIEILLGMMYDLLYTKAPLLYTCGGLVLRLITFFVTFTVMVLFTGLVDQHNNINGFIGYMCCLVDRAPQRFHHKNTELFSTTEDAAQHRHC
ncbi:hypothetical protein QYF36_009720 [Acer negundo]|nr:hypothetical protein QYF36_009720 [Acer negundo]